MADENEKPSGEEQDAAASEGDAPADDSADEAAGPKETEKAVDEDWKAEARREKEKLEQKEEEQASEKAGAQMPPADFMHFFSGMAAQALMQLGVIDNPFEGEKKLDLAAARYSIDVMQMLADKTKGNLTDEEDEYVRAALHDLRMRFVAAAQDGSAGTDEAAG